MYFLGFTCIRLSDTLALNHFLVHHFETIPNSKKMQTTEMWLLKDFLKDTDCKENIVEKGEIAQNEQFHFFPQCFPKPFFFHCVKMSIYGGKGLNQVDLMGPEPICSKSRAVC